MPVPFARPLTEGRHAYGGLSELWDKVICGTLLIDD